MKTPPKNGTWIIKNSYRIEFDEEGYNYISYYDTSFATTDRSVGFIFENTEKYNKNYQTDLSRNIKFYNYKIVFNSEIYFYFMKNNLIYIKKNII